MPYIQKNTPPPNKVLTFSLKDFSGGLNNRSELLQDNQASDLMNMAFMDDTIMEKRRGTTNFDTLVLPDEVIFVDEYLPYNDLNIMVRATKTELYFGNVKIKNVNGQMTGANYQGKYFIADGIYLNVYGKFPQVASTYVGVTGTPIAVYTLMRVVNPPSGYTPLDTTHVKGKTVYNYTTMQVWYEPCQNEIEDTFKQANTLPESPRYIISHNGRMYASGSEKDNDNVFITDIHNPYYFPAALPIQLPPNSDKVVGMAVFDDSVVVGRHKDIYAITGNTNNPNLGSPVFRLQRVNSHTGFANHRALDAAHNYLFFLGSDGNAYALASTASNKDEALNSSILTRNIDMFRSPINLLRTDLSSACSGFFEDMWYLSMKDKILVYSYRHQAWTVYKNIFARAFYVFENVLIWGDMYGRISMPSENYLDYGVPYSAHWTSKNFDMDDVNSNKQFREFYLLAHTFDTRKSDIHVNFQIDYVNVDSDVVVSNQISIWGVSVFGDRFITRNINASIPFVIGRRGREIRFTVLNGYDLHDKVTNRSDLDIYVGRKEGMLMYVMSENKYYLFKNSEWLLLSNVDLDQPMLVYQMNGDYEFRGKR